MEIIPSIKLAIIEKGELSNKILSEETANKKIIIFGVPGAFTPLCSDQHLPGFIKLSDQLRSKGIQDIYCLSVNDAFVMRAWLKSYPTISSIKGIADGNSDFSNAMNLSIDYSANFMGKRCKRFALIAEKNNILELFVENKGQYYVSSAENILKKL